jgi:hypothetical protein
MFLGVVNYSGVLAFRGGLLEPKPSEKQEMNVFVSFPFKTTADEAKATAQFLLRIKP